MRLTQGGTLGGDDGVFLGLWQGGGEPHRAGREGLREGGTLGLDAGQGGGGFLHPSGHCHGGCAGAAKGAGGGFVQGADPVEG